MSIIKRKAGSEDIVKSVLEFDEVPTEGSSNLVESGTVARAIEESEQRAADCVVFDISPYEGRPYPTFSEINSAIGKGKTAVLRVTNYNGQSDSPADYYYLTNFGKVQGQGASFVFSNGSNTKTVHSVDGWSDGNEYDSSVSNTSTNAPQSKAVSEAIANAEIAILSNITIAANTLRISFSKKDYDPTVAGVGTSGTWTKLATTQANVWDWTNLGNDWSDSFNETFTDPSNEVRVIASGDTSSVTTFFRFFRLCTSLVDCCLIDTSNATRTTSMFSTTNIKKIPIFDTGKAADVQYMFFNCVNVENGALALYQQMSTQTTPPSFTKSCFQSCGENTTTGAAELAQIPKSWGGNAPNP